jgi:glycosyltransferase involved in cell wall biosynthesis
MSRVAVVTSSPPFVRGGHLVIATELVRALREAGHESEVVLTPQNRFGRQTSAYVATWLTDVGRSADDRPIDQVISLRFPSYAVRHPRHVCWLNHTMREYYDLWGRFSGSLSPQGRVKERIRRAAIRAADSYLLRSNVTRLFAQSQTIRERLRFFNGADAEVLYPPAPARPYRCDGYEAYVFAYSRLTPLKRMDLLLRALAEPEAAGIRCVIGGEGEQSDELQALAASLRLQDRVTFEGRLSDDALVTHLARCRAVCFVPLQEDYGFVTVEAFASRKAVVTCRDSGGPAELVTPETGVIADAAPASVAGALRRLIDDADLAARLGAAAHQRAAQLTWPDTVRRLLLV